ncbi:ABC transporter substrate-binding protein [Leifsonia sp. A12D58]|uniref:ABC transporter substrate-binding protein n=1 Tax=Leifsonia sp. A12D58 TaxID=3397674 RepID=UPI0039E03160
MTNVTFSGMKILVPAIAIVLLASGCSSGGSAEAEGEGLGEESGASVDANGNTVYPLTVQNCDVDVTFDAAPERVILLESAPVTILHGLGVLDVVTLRAGLFPPAYYDDETNTAIEAIPSLGKDVDASGHLQISQEVVIAEQPELVLGLPDGITREGLADVGVSALIQPVYCPAGVGKTSFDSLYDQIESYGLIFDRNAEAAEMIESLQARVTDAKAAVDPSEGRTAAVLYPTIGGGTGYAYGNTSMSQPQLDAAGFTNVFADVDERVFEVSLEELIARDPDVLVLLYGDGDPADIKAAVTALPGADSLRAVANDDILVQRFNFTEPPTPLSVTGLETIIDRFGTTP